MIALADATRGIEEFQHSRRRLEKKKIMQVAIYPDLATISREATDYVVRVAQEAIAARGQFSIALSGGTTPGQLYGLLTSEPYRSQIDWSAVQIGFAGQQRSKSTRLNSSHT